MYLQAESKTVSGIIFFISQAKLMLWVSQRSLSMRRGYFVHPQHMLDLMDKKIAPKFC